MYKICFLVIGLLFCGQFLSAQDSSAIRESLYNELRKDDDRYNYSKRDLLDSLSDYSCTADFMRYAHDSSSVLRYIGFMAILREDDETAFRILEEYIEDYSNIIYFGETCLFRYSYNEVILQEYLFYIYNYLDGSGMCTGWWFCFAGTGKDFNTWERKKRQLVEMLNRHGQLKMLDYTDEKNKYHVYHLEKDVKAMRKYYSKSIDEPLMLY